jgi:hypothetical protein
MVILKITMILTTDIHPKQLTHTDSLNLNFERVIRRRATAYMLFLLSRFKLSQQLISFLSQICSTQILSSMSTLHGHQIWS